MPITRLLRLSEIGGHLFSNRGSVKGAPMSTTKMRTIKMGKTEMSKTKMSKRNTRIWLGGLAALVFALPLVSMAKANETILPCVQRDLDLVTLIEEHGNASAVPGPILAEAMLAVLEARTPC